MPTINLPYNIQNGDPLDADKVMADLQTITALLNGSLDSDNLQSGTPVSQPGSVANAGVASAFLRSDALFAIQGFEHSSSLPTTGNFLGRCIFLTTDSKLYYCTNTAGSGTYVVIANMAPVDVPVHGAQHADGAHDPLPDKIITDHHLGARVLTAAHISADSSAISTSTYTTIIDLVLPSTLLQNQVIMVTGGIKFSNTNGSNKPSVAMRIQDVTASSVTIWRTNGHQLGIAGGGSDAFVSNYAFPYTIPANGARTLRLQAGSDIGTVIARDAGGTFNTETFAQPNIAAVLI